VALRAGLADGLLFGRLVAVLPPHAASARAAAHPVTTIVNLTAHTPVA
jgi:hypothetical protein